MMNQNSKKDITGAVMVVGGGIAGIQASLDLAESGFLVHLVERSGGIGGRMSQLDKTFPTNDCSMCMISPKLIGCASHPNINIITKAEVMDLKGNVGNFSAVIKKHPRYIIEDKCVGCGICAQKCPVKVEDTFNEGLSPRKAVFLKYPQSVPLIYEIDRDHCIYFKKGRCRACEKFCNNNAVDFNQQEDIRTIHVGSVILAPGYDLFAGEHAQEYGYGRYDNVMTTMEFERCLSATGPSDGKVLRNSDRTVPEKVAWIQCVGSRESIRKDREFCSSICCMAATKEAVIAADHHPELVPTIFFMDLRAQGKGFDDYCQRAEKNSRIRYVRSMISRVAQNPVSRDLILEYISPETGQKAEEAFNMVVLSVGMKPSESVRTLADRLNVRLNRFGFVQSRPDNPLFTSRDGVYVCGCLESPKDIPETVAQASAAAAQAAIPIASARGYEIKPPVLPPERSLFGIKPKVGVFVCCCGTNIAGVVDVQAVADDAQSLPNVVFTQVLMFACSTDSKLKIKEQIQAHDINRVVVASCSPKTHEPLFRDTLQEAGLNPYLLEMSNIRNQCSWVHAGMSEIATQKAMDLVRMSVQRVIFQEPINSKPVPVVPMGLVIGGGIAGMTAAVTLADQGFHTHLTEISESLGGQYGRTPFDMEGFNAGGQVQDLIHKIENHPLVTVHLNTQVTRTSGHIGNFVTEMRTGQKPPLSIRHGVYIVATGFEENRPELFGLGTRSDIVTQSDLSRTLNTDKTALSDLETVVMIQCVGSRDENNPYCSRVCCTQAVENALELRRIKPEMNVIVLYRDIRTFGFKELIYKEARQNGVLFVRFDPDSPPEVNIENDRLKIGFTEPALSRDINIPVDLLVLSVGKIPHCGSSKLADVLKLPRDAQGYFLEAHVKLRPLDFTTDGMFLCGDAHGPKFPSEAVVQAAGAAGRAACVLSRKFIVVGPSSQVDPELCAACMTCVRTCPYGVPYINEDGVSQIDPARCKGCGMCAAECPAQAITVHHHRNDQIQAKVSGLFQSLRN